MDETAIVKRLKEIGEEAKRRAASPLANYNKG